MTNPAQRRLTMLVAGVCALASLAAGAMVATSASADSGAGAGVGGVSVGVRPAKPLTGVVIALDPGHQLGNSNPAFATELSQTRWNGTIVKGCNTTGTATDGGYPEATFNWHVALKVRRTLTDLGATVHMTRSVNSWNAWGPCTWDRGKFGASVGADFMVSLHADGAIPSGHGFFIIAPAVTKGWTDDIATESRRLARAMIAGMTKAGATPSTYISGATLVWNDQNTLNFADVPTVIVEQGNMRNAGDAARMTSRAGRDEHARWIVAGIRRYLHR